MKRDQQWTSRFFPLPRQEGDVPCLLRFDGVGDHAAEGGLGESQNRHMGHFQPEDRSQELLVAARTRPVVVNVVAPAYDRTFAKWTTEHEMRVAGRRGGMSRDDLLAVGRAFGIRAPARLLNRVEEVVARWPDYAEDFGMKVGMRQRIKPGPKARSEKLKA